MVYCMFLRRCRNDTGATIRDFRHTKGCCMTVGDIDTTDSRETARPEIRRARWQRIGPAVQRPVDVPLRWQQYFPGWPEQIGRVRTFVEFLVSDCPAASDAVWVAGELATNAITHSRSGLPGNTFLVGVLRWRWGLEIRITDAGSDIEPIPAQADLIQAALDSDNDLPEHGFGLYAIGALAERFGTYHVPDGRRIVWARLKSHPRRGEGAE